MAKKSSPTRPFRLYGPLHSDMEPTKLHRCKVRGTFATKTDAKKTAPNYGNGFYFILEKGAKKIRPECFAVWNVPLPKTSALLAPMPEPVGPFVVWSISPYAGEPGRMLDTPSLPEAIRCVIEHTDQPLPRSRLFIADASENKFGVHPTEGHLIPWSEAQPN